MRSFRMDKSDVRTASTLARLFVDELDALCLEVSKSSFEVIHAQSNMLNAAAAAVLCDELRNRGGVLSRSKELDLAAVRRREEARRNLLLCNRLFTVVGETECFRIERTDFFEKLTHHQLI